MTSSHKFEALDLCRSGDYGVAIPLFERTIEEDDNDYITLTNLALCYHKIGQLTLAQDYLEKALSINETYSQAHFNLGCVYLDLNKIDAAIKSFRSYLKHNPLSYDGNLNLSICYHKIKAYEKALFHVDIAIKQNKDLGEAFFNKANILADMGALHEAKKAYQMSLSINPNLAEAYANIAAIFFKEHKFSKAIECYTQALGVKINSADYYSNRGVCYKEISNFYSALKDFDRAIEIDPSHSEAHWNRSILKLLHEEFDTGLPDYEYRKKLKNPHGVFSYAGVPWDGKASLKNKTILVYAEQGIGDIFQFCRFLNKFDKRETKIYFLCRNNLVSLLETLGSHVNIISEITQIEHFDYHIPLLSLPYAFNIQVNSLVREGPYLFAEEHRINKWKSILGQHGIKIGIAWSSGNSDIRRGRFFPLDVFKSIADLKDVRLISLHRNDNTIQKDISSVSFKIETLDNEYDVGDQSFLDCIAVMKCCDLVISCDTSIIHLAGAAGVKSWLPLEVVPHWVWFLNRCDSPWYPNLTLFRQINSGDWDEVFSNIRAALKEQFHTY